MNCLLVTHEVYLYDTKVIVMESTDMKRFMRIAMARMRNEFKYEPQRRAVCAKMYVKWLKRKGYE